MYYRLLFVSLCFNIILFLVYWYRYIRSEKYTLILDDGTIDNIRIIKVIE